MSRLHPLFADILAAFQKTPTVPLDMVGASDGYVGNWTSLPVGTDKDGRPYLEAGAAPDFSGLKGPQR